MFEKIKKVIRKIKDPGSHGEKRSKEWSKVRKKHLEKEPFCAACGGENKLQVHHCEPFHLYPELELDPNNLITLCENKNKDHLKVGHLGNFKNYNPNVKHDAAEMLKKLHKK